MKPVFLVGFMGSGKSTVAPMLAKRMGLELVDIDKMVAEAEGMSIPDIFRTHGESAFRKAERAALMEAAAREDVVVATGGGIVENERNRAHMRWTGIPVYLRVSSAESLARVGADATGRPLMDGAEPSRAAALLVSREHFYEDTAAITIDTDGKTPDEVTDELAAVLEESRA